MSVKHALVVDDSKSAGLALRRLLEQTKVAVDMAESAEAALKYLEGNKPDVIFMDHIMPGMNGFEAAKAITGNPKTSAIPIIMYTSKDDAGYLESAKAHGAVGILPKPPKAETLNVVLTTLSGGAPPPMPARAPAAAPAAGAAAAAPAVDHAAIKGLLEEFRREFSSKIEQVARETAGEVFRTRGVELSHQIRKQIEEQIAELSTRIAKPQGLTPAEMDGIKAVAAESGAREAVESAKRVAHDVATHAAQETAKKTATDTARQIAAEAARHAAEQQYQISMGGLAEKLLAQVKPEIEELRGHMREHKPLDEKTTAEIQKIATAAAQQKAAEAAQRSARETALSVSQQAAGQMVDEAIDQLKRELGDALDPQLNRAKMLGYVGIAMSIAAIALVFVFR